MKSEHCRLSVHKQGTSYYLIRRILLNGELTIEKCGWILQYFLELTQMCKKKIWRKEKKTKQHIAGWSSWGNMKTCLWFQISLSTVTTVYIKMVEKVLGNIVSSYFLYHHRWQKNWFPLLRATGRASILYHHCSTVNKDPLWILISLIQHCVQILFLLTVHHHHQLHLRVVHGM